jgi:hypothetical protein
MPSPPYTRPTLLINDVDYTDYLSPQTLDLSIQAQQGVASAMDFALRQVPGSFSVEGGKRVDFYLAGQTAPLFSGLHTRSIPRRYAPQTWQYICRAVGWESAFYRKQLFTSIRGVSYEGACNQILTDPEQTFPVEIMTTVSGVNDILAGDMPFFAVNGAFPGEIFDLIASLTGTVWRVTPNGTKFQLQFFDPFTTYSGFELNQTNKTFKWNSFEPSISSEGVINTQSLKGSQAAVDTEDVAYFRGDNLSSKFDLPTKPFNNEASVVMFDSFNSAPINTSLWFETDVTGNHVYADGVGFIQFDTAVNDWVGIISRPLAARDGGPMCTIDITWVADGIAQFGFTPYNVVPADGTSFLDAGVYIDATGQVFGISNGAIIGQSGVNLAPSTQYRFRIKTKAAGGCVIQYQEGASIYSRNWTTLFDTDTGAAEVLGTAVMTYSAGITLAMVKTVYPYLGVKLEVDRGSGFGEEEVGVYPIDEDVDAVILEESTIAFFGSDPGPSTIPPAPTWQADPDYKNIRVTYRRGVNIFATYRDNDSINAIAALFGGTDSGVREGPVITDDSITSYQAALARAKTEVDNRSNIVSSIVAETQLNILDDAGMVLPECGKSARYTVTIPTTNYVISKDIPIRKVRYRAKTGLNDIDIATEGGYLSRGLRTVLQELKVSGKLISINENQVIYVGKSITEALALTEAVTSFGAGTTRRWGDSRLSRTFTVNTTTELLTVPTTALFATGDDVRVQSAGTLPTPLLASSVYYINRQSSTTFLLYDTLANALVGGATGKVNLTDTGTGTHTLFAYGWRWGNHRWNSFMKQVEIRGRCTMVATARTFKRIHLQEEVVLNVIARVF